MVCGCAANQRRLVLDMKDGSTKVLRLNTLAKYVSGQKEFTDKAAETLSDLPARQPNS